PRICDLGFLSEIVRAHDGALVHRCPAEPLSLYLSKGGNAEDAAGRKCLCNALMANIGHQQVRCGPPVEPPLVTAGDDLTEIVAGGGEGRLDVGAAADLLVADVGHESVAETLAAGGVFGVASFGKVERQRLGGAAMNEGAVVGANDFGEEAKVADAG